VSRSWRNGPHVSIERDVVVAFALSGMCASGHAAWTSAAGGTGKELLSPEQEDIRVIVTRRAAVAAGPLDRREPGQAPTHPHIAIASTGAITERDGRLEAVKRRYGDGNGL
jgi:hypothetical protein